MIYLRLKKRLNNYPSISFITAPFITENTATIKPIFIKILVGGKNPFFSITLGLSQSFLPKL